MIDRYSKNIWCLIWKVGGWVADIVAALVGIIAQALPTLPDSSRTAQDFVLFAVGAWLLARAFAIIIKAWRDDS